MSRQATRDFRTLWASARAAILVLTLGVLLAVPTQRLLPASALPASDGLAAQVPGGAQVAEVRLSSLQPSVAEAGDVLRLSGTLANTSEIDLVDPLPALRWSGDPLQSIDEVDLVDANPLFRYGRIDYRFADPVASLAPGEQAEFSIEVPLPALGIRDGVYVIGVDVLATLPDGLRVFVADDRTTVPVGIAVDDPLPVAVLWPLASAPSLLPDGRLVDDRLGSEVSGEGRLSRLLSTAGDVPVTWVVDPDLVTTLTQMADGYQTLDPDGAGSAADDARRYLDDVADLLGGAEDVRRMPAADPDVGGALSADVDAAVVGEAVADSVADPAASVLLERRLPSVALLADRPVDEQMLGVYQSSGVSTPVLSASAVTSPNPDGAATVALESGSDVAAIVARVPPTGEPDTGTPGEDGLRTRQWMLSASAVHAALGAGASMVVAPGPRWNPSTAEADGLLSAWTSTDWIDPVPLSGVPAQVAGADADDSAVRLAAEQSPAPLPPSIAEGLQGVLADSERLAPLFPEPVIDSSEQARVVARATSAAWQDDPDGGTVYMASLSGQVVDAESRISLVVSPSITLASRSGRFPITLVNDAALDVLVGVSFVSQNSSRLRVEDIEPVVLTAGEKRTFTATALATANGRLQVNASLVTTEGTRVGTPATTIVDVTNVGALGWTVIGLGGMLLLAALVRSRLRSRRVDATRAAS